VGARAYGPSPLHPDGRDARAPDKSRALSASRALLRLWRGSAYDEAAMSMSTLWPGDAGKRLVVSIHDVRPSLEREVRYLLAALDAVGARLRVLKVVPNADGREDMRASARLTRLIADEAAAGSEIVLHGYTHRAAGRARGSLSTRLRARLFAGDAAEFLTLDRSEMVRRLHAGRETLREIGVEPAGFCAPCWLAAPEMPGALAECGFRYYITMNTLIDLAGGRRVWTPWAGYMGAGGAQERLIGGVGRAYVTAAGAAPVVKVFLHPQRAIGVRASGDTVRLLSHLLRARQPTTYAALLAR
jgi:predicted deacetylase